MKTVRVVSLLSLVLAIGAAVPLSAELVDATLESQIVPSPVEYYALLPPGFDGEGEALPLVLNLHGGGGDREGLKRQQRLIESLWADGTLPPMVVVMPSVTTRGFYMDFRDGSEKWETFIIEEFLPHLRQRFGLRTDRRGTMVTGISMGGMGSARMAFKYPDVFGAVASMEPGIEPILEWSEMRLKHRFWRADALLEKAYGQPVDADYWAANNPATIVTRTADKIRDSGLRIFLDAGDQDLFWLYEGTEFLHQVLWNERIRHEYRLYNGADHVGASLGPRTIEAFRFLARTLVDPQPDPVVENARRRIDPLKRRLREADHYGVDAALVGQDR